MDFGFMEDLNYIKGKEQRVELRRSNRIYSDFTFLCKRGKRKYLKMCFF